MRNAGLGEAQAGIKISRRNINNLRHTDDTTLMAESEELKSLLMKEWKSWLKAQHSENEGHGIRSHHFIANDGETVEQWQTLFLGSKKLQMVTAAMKLKYVPPWKKSYDRFNLDSTLKSRDIPLPTKVHLLKAMVLPVVMYGCESWTIKKAEC